MSQRNRSQAARDRSMSLDHRLQTLRNHWQSPLWLAFQQIKDGGGVWPVGLPPAGTRRVRFTKARLNIQIIFTEKHII